MKLILQSLSVFNRRKNYFCQLLNVYAVNYVRYTDMHTAETLVTESVYILAEIDIEKLKSYKSSPTDQIQAELN